MADTSGAPLLIWPPLLVLCAGQLLLALLAGSPAVGFNALRS